MSRPSRNTTLMRQAELIAERSTCSRARVGVVIALEGRVISQGYNGAPAGMLHCNHECNCENKSSRPECICPPNSKDGHWDFCKTRLKIWKEDDPHLTTCPAATTGCTTAVHAEANAVAFAARYGVSTNGASLYTTVAPCLACSQLIINAGIIAVYWLNPYRDRAGLGLLMEARLDLISWPNGTPV